TPKYKDLLEKEQIEFYPNPDVKPLWIIPQDISRVIESTLSNAAYWTLKKEKQGVADYKPLIKINITDLQSETEISISDNGLGITEQSINKIFQPFYTTKPAGEGTGLGLSLTYDIITRGYGGSISVKSKEGEGATFIVRIPKQNP
nr:HAMP domain-containing histidine kinase [Chitinophagaceae bacterium]